MGARFSSEAAPVPRAGGESLRRRSVKIGARSEEIREQYPNITVLYNGTLLKNDAVSAASNPFSYRLPGESRFAGEPTGRSEFPLPPVPREGGLWQGLPPCAGALCSDCLRCVSCGLYAGRISISHVCHACCMRITSVLHACYMRIACVLHAW